MNCLVNPDGGSGHCDSFQERNVINFSSEHLLPGEWIEITAGFEKGVVTESVKSEDKVGITRLSWLLVASVAGFFVVLFLWISKIRRLIKILRGDRSVLTDNLLSSEKRALINRKVQSKYGGDDAEKIAQKKKFLEIFSVMFPSSFRLIENSHSSSNFERKLMISFIVGALIFIGSIVFVYLALSQGGQYYEGLMNVVWYFMGE